MIPYLLTNPTAEYRQLFSKWSTECDQIFQLLNITSFSKCSINCDRNRPFSLHLGPILVASSPMHPLTYEQVLEQRDREPGQHEAGQPEAGAAHQQQVDRHVQAAHAEREEREVHGVSLDVVKELEDGQSGRGKLKEGN